MAYTSIIPRSPYELAFSSPPPANVRLTLVSGQPVMSSSVNNQSNVFATPYKGNIIPTFNPSTGGWQENTFTELTLGLVNGSSAGQVTTNSNYDIYYAINQSTGLGQLYLSPAWSTDTILGSNPASAEVTTIAGIDLNRWDLASGVGAMRGTRLGTIRTNGTNGGTVDWKLGASSVAGFSSASLGVFNMYNRVAVSVQIGDTSTYTYTANTIRPAGGNSTAARISFVRSVDQEAITARHRNFMVTSTGATNASIGVGLDSLTAYAGFQGFSNPAAATLTGGYDGLTGIGFHFVEALEDAITAATVFGTIASMTTQCSALTLTALM